MRRPRTSVASSAIMAGMTQVFNPGDTPINVGGVSIAGRAHGQAAPSDQLSTLLARGDLVETETTQPAHQEDPKP